MQYCGPKFFSFFPSLHVYVTACAWVRACVRASERECVRVYDFRKLMTAAILVEEIAETEIYI